MLMILLVLSAMAYDPETPDVEIDPEAFAQMEEKLDDATVRLEELVARLEAATQEEAEETDDGTADGAVGDTEEPAPPEDTDDPDEVDAPEEDGD